MKTTPPIRVLTVIALAGISFLLNSGFASLPADAPGVLNLPVKPLHQRKVTSCGEAAITMAYNYAYPQGPLKELDVIAFSLANGYYIDNRPPFTSPANMVKIAKYYTDDPDRRFTNGVESGRVTAQAQGLKLLIKKLQNNQPVIIDVLTRLYNRYSGAHFVLVTGISMDLKHPDVIVIYYNDPLTARNESALWSGAGGVWNAWQNNGDPDGAGWWLAISASK